MALHGVALLEVEARPLHTRLEEVIAAEAADML